MFYAPRVFFMSIVRVLRKEMLTLKKPSGGIPPNKIDHIVGKKLNKDASSNFLLRIEDISNI